jgi:hypothetical protein
MKLILTKQYIMDNRTEAGSWTKSQMIALGVGWGAKKGWLGRIIGEEISEENAEIFERKIKAKSTKSDVDSACNLVIRKMCDITDTRFRNLVKAVFIELEERS